MHTMEYVNNLSAAHTLSDCKASKNKAKRLGKEKQTFKNAALKSFKLLLSLHTCKRTSPKQNQYKHGLMEK